MIKNTKGRGKVTFPFFSANSMYFIGASVFFFGLSSKNIIVYNEELLISLSFLAFCVTSVYGMGNAISEALQTHRILIQKELQAFFTSKKTLLRETKFCLHSQIRIYFILRLLRIFARKELRSLHLQRNVTVQNIVHTYTLKQLEQLLHKEQVSGVVVHTVSSVSDVCAMREKCFMNAIEMEELIMHHLLYVCAPMLMHEKLIVSRSLSSHN